MPFSGNTHSRPSPNPLAVDGVVADSSDFEGLMNDFSTSLTACAKAAVANVFTEVQTIRSDDAGALYTALIQLLYRNSATPAAADGLGGFVVDGNDSGGNQTRYGGVIVVIADTTDTTEDGVMTFRTVRAGTFTIRFNIGDGLYGQGLTDLGANTGSFAHIGITDGVTAPSAVSGVAQIYVDSSGGDLKIAFGDGTVKTIVTDT